MGVYLVATWLVMELTHHQVLLFERTLDEASLFGLKRNVSLIFAPAIRDGQQNEPVRFPESFLQVTQYQATCELLVSMSTPRTTPDISTVLSLAQRSQLVWQLMLSNVHIMKTLALLITFVDNILFSFIFLVSEKY